MKEKISVISPCYNGENHLKPYIEGLLSQTYTNVEYIFVNDGSDDKTEEIILSYKQKFLDKGWEFIYLAQKTRQGQAAAINRGLEIFTGEYLCCPDSDDVLLPEYLELMSAFLNEHKECKICYPWTEVVEEKSGKHLKYFKRHIPPHTVDMLFDELITGQKKGENAILFSTYMLRSKEFLKVYKNRQIFPGFSGQNDQMTLPFIYNSKVGYVEKILYKCIARTNSDSRLVSYEDRINKSYSWEQNACEAIKCVADMPDYEKAYYFNLIKQRFAKCRKRWTKGPIKKFLNNLKSGKFKL